MQHFQILYLPDNVHCNEKSSWVHAACFQTILYLFCDSKWFSLLSVTHLVLSKTQEKWLNAAAVHSSALNSVSHPVLVVAGKKTTHISKLQCPVSEWVHPCEPNTHTHSRTYWRRVCVRPLMVSVKLFRCFLPIVLVPVASLLGSYRSPCSLSHDDLHRTYIHTLTSTTWRLQHWPLQKHFTCWI